MLEIIGFVVLLITACYCSVATFFFAIYDSGIFGKLSFLSWVLIAIAGVLWYATVHFFPFTIGIA